MPAQGVSARWLDKRRPQWDRLAAFVDRCAAHGIGALDHTELREFALLYRQAAADLSVLREDRASVATARHLNTLLGRAHNFIYSGTRPAARGIAHFYGRVFPGVFRETLPYTLASLALFAAGLVAGAAISWSDPAFERVILGGAMMDTIEQGRMWTHSIVAIKPLASSAIMTNNLSVSFAAFAGGMLAGAGTVYVMLFNGVLMGVVAVACDRAGLSQSLWSFVAPHGVLELPALFIAGGAGLLLGKGMLVPGDLPRTESLAETATLAIRLLLGVVPMLMIAGLIEGFVSPSDAAAGTKFAIGGGLFVILAAYVGLVRPPTRDSAP